MLGPKMEAFLAAYEECGSVLRTAERAKVHRDAHYKALKASAEYADRFKDAKRNYGLNRAKVQERLAEMVAPALELVEARFRFLSDPENATAIELSRADCQLIDSMLDRAGLKAALPVTGEGGKGPIQVIVRSVLDPKPE